MKRTYTKLEIQEYKRLKRKARQERKRKRIEQRRKDYLLLHPPEKRVSLTPYPKSRNLVKYNLKDTDL